MGLPVTPAPSAILPPPGIAFMPTIPSVHLEIVQIHRRGDPPLLITGVLPWLVGCSTLRKAEWYDSCSIAEPDFLALVNEAKKLPPRSCRREHHLVLRQVKSITEKAKKTAYFVIPDTMPPDIAMVLKKVGTQPRRCSHGHPTRER